MKKSISEKLAKRNDVAAGWASDAFEKDSKGDYYLMGDSVTRAYLEAAVEGDYAADWNKRFLVGHGPDDEGIAQACWAVKLNPLG